jgi:hypothetical protein
MSEQCLRRFRRRDFGLAKCVSVGRGEPIEGNVRLPTWTSFDPRAKLTLGLTSSTCHFLCFLCSL